MTFVCSQLQIKRSNVIDISQTDGKGSQRRTTKYILSLPFRCDAICQTQVSIFRPYSIVLMAGILGYYHILQTYSWTHKH